MGAQGSLIHLGNGGYPVWSSPGTAYWHYAQYYGLSVYLLMSSATIITKVLMSHLALQPNQNSILFCIIVISDRTAATRS